MSFPDLKSAENSAENIPWKSWKKSENTDWNPIRKHLRARETHERLPGFERDRRQSFPSRSATSGGHVYVYVTHTIHIYICYICLSYIYIPILDNVEIIYGRKLMSILYIYIYIMVEIMANIWYIAFLIIYIFYIGHLWYLYHIEIIVDMLSMGRNHGQS